jgi:hypothetical protein
MRLLESIAAGDWGTYAELCDASLTCFEPEAQGTTLSTSGKDVLQPPLAGTYTDLRRRASGHLVEGIGARRARTWKAHLDEADVGDKTHGAAAEEGDLGRGHGGVDWACPAILPALGRSK